MIQKISEEKKIPASTLRYNIRQLTSYGLLTCGNIDNKGVPTRLTDEGRLILKILETFQNEPKMTGKSNKVDYYD